MPSTNDGVFSGLKRLTGRFREVQVDGVPGALNPSRYRGATQGGPPTSGSFRVGDWIVDLATGTYMICITGGNPGTWRGPSIYQRKSGDWVQGLAQWGGYATRTVGEVWAIPFYITPGLTVSQVGLYVNSAGSADFVLHFGLYTDDLGWPNQLQCDLGDVAVGASTGYFTAAVTPSARPTGGMMWAAIWFKAGTTIPSIQFVNSIASYLQAAASFIATQSNNAFLPKLTGQSSLPSTWSGSRGSVGGGPNQCPGLALKLI